MEMLSTIIPRRLCIFNGLSVRDTDQRPSVLLPSLTHGVFPPVRPGGIERADSAVRKPGRSFLNDLSLQSALPMDGVSMGPSN